MICGFYGEIDSKVSIQECPEFFAPTWVDFRRSQKNEKSNPDNRITLEVSDISVFDAALKTVRVIGN